MRISLLCFLLLSSAHAAEFYFATNGQDEDSGSRNKPFATLARARNEVRKLIAKGLMSDVTVWIGGGTYALSETLVLGPEDSGTDNHLITYAAVPGEEPIISSGVKIEGWKMS
jgi:hypothetical protein